MPAVRGLAIRVQGVLPCHTPQSSIRPWNIIQTAFPPHSTVVYGCALVCVEDCIRLITKFADRWSLVADSASIRPWGGERARCNPGTLVLWYRIRMRSVNEDHLMGWRARQRRGRGRGLGKGNLPRLTGSEIIVSRSLCDQRGLFDLHLLDRSLNHNTIGTATTSLALRHPSVNTAPSHSLWVPSPVIQYIR